MYLLLDGNSTESGSEGTQQALRTAPASSTQHSDHILSLSFRLKLFLHLQKPINKPKTKVAKNVYSLDILNVYIFVQTAMLGVTPSGKDTQVKVALQPLHQQKRAVVDIRGQ